MSPYQIYRYRRSCFANCHRRESYNINKVINRKPQAYGMARNAVASPLINRNMSTNCESAIARGRILSLYQCDNAVCLKRTSSAVAVLYAAAGHERETVMSSRALITLRATLK